MKAFRSGFPFSTKRGREMHAETKRGIESASGAAVTRVVLFNGECAVPHKRVKEQDTRVNLLATPEGHPVCTSQYWSMGSERTQEPPFPSL